MRWRKIAARSGKHGRSVADPRNLLEKAKRQTNLQGNLLPFPVPASIPPSGAIKKVKAKNHAF